MRRPALTLALALVALVARADDLASYRSPALPSSRAGIVFTIGHPGDWAVAWGGERTRFYPPDASEGPLSAATFVHVDAIARDEAGVDGLLSDKGGLETWVGATRPRWEIEDRRRAKVGATDETREALLVKDPAHGTEPDRRELVVLVPAGDVNFLVRCSAPLAEFSRRDGLFRAILHSFQPSGG